MDCTKHVCYASIVNISDIEQSKIYLTVKARLFETPGANLNGVRVTAEFLDEIINNEAKYVGLPLYADVHNLETRNYERLGHLYNPTTGEFLSTQIGSFYKFEKELTEDGAALIGYARIMKRNTEVCKAIAELFALGSLKFSFEIACSSVKELDDGTMQIDADENNYLEGMAVVWFPACEDAVALQLVAQHGKANDVDEDVTTMGENIVTTASSTLEFTTDSGMVYSNRIDNGAVYGCEIASASIPADKLSVAPAEIVIDHVEAETVEPESEKVEVVSEAEESEKMNAEAEEPAQSGETEAAECNTEDKDPEEPEDEEAAAKKKCCSEDETVAQADKTVSSIAHIEEAIKSIAEVIAEIKSRVDELSSLKTQYEAVIASAEEEVEAPVNPIVAEISVETKKWSLLESEAPVAKSYSLLERA